MIYIVCIPYCLKALHIDKIHVAKDAITKAIKLIILQ